MSASTVLVTGGAGFLGRHVVDALFGVGLGVRTLDRADGSGRDDVDHHVADVRDLAACLRATRGVDVVVHSAFAAPDRPAREIVEVNRDGTRNLLDAAVAAGVRRVVLVSSTIVARRTRTHPLLRRSPVARLDLYRRSRVEAEALASAYADRGLRIAIARPKTLLGPGRVGAFAMLFEWLRLGRRVPVLGDGTNAYQLVDVRDFAEALRLLSITDATGVFELGSMRFATVREDLQALVDHASTGARLVFVPGVVARAGMRAIELAGITPLSEWHAMSAGGIDSIVDVSRASRELGWRSRYSNAEALVDAFDWYADSIQARGSAEATRPLPRVHDVVRRLTASSRGR